MFYMRIDNKVKYVKYLSRNRSAYVRIVESKFYIESSLHALILILISL